MTFKSKEEFLETLATELDSIDWENSKVIVDFFIVNYLLDEASTNKFEYETEKYPTER